MVQAQVSLVDGATHPAEGVPAGSSAVTLMCSAVGAGVLSLPYAFEKTGWAGGLALIGFIAAVESFTLYVLARSAEHTSTLTYSRLVRRMLGPAAGVFLSLVALAFLFGSCCAYLIALGDSFSPLLTAAAGEVWWTRREAVITFVGTAVILPLCFPRSLGALAGVSSIVLYGLMLVVGAVVYRSSQAVRGPGYEWSQVHAFVLRPSFFQALPILVYGFQCHTNVITVFREMVEDPKLLSPLLTPLISRSATPNPTSHGGSQALAATAAAATAATAFAAVEAGVTAEAAEDGNQALLPAADRTEPGEERHADDVEETPPLRPLPPRQLRSTKLLGMMRVVYTAVGLVSGFYSVMGLAGYLAFPTNIKTNILLMFPHTDALVQVARATIGLILCISYPVAHHPARAAMYDLLMQLCGGRGIPGFRTVETLVYYLATLAISLTVTDLGAVFRLIGGTCGSILIFGGPGALLMNHSLHKQRALCLGMLLQAQGPQGDQRLQQAYRVWTSKLWWAGLLLVLLTVALVGYTGWSVAAGL